MYLYLVKINKYVKKLCATPSIILNILEAKSNLASCFYCNVIMGYLFFVYCLSSPCWVYGTSQKHFICWHFLFYYSFVLY